MSKTMQLFREGKVAEAIKEFDATYNLKVMTAGEAMLAVQVRSLGKQIGVLRFLVKESRQAFHSLPHGNGRDCMRCRMVGMIDDALAEIAEGRND